MPIGAALAGTAVAGVGGALISSGAAKSAAQTQSDAALQAAQLQLQAAQTASQTQLGMFNTIRGDLTPYRSVGTSALPGYYALLGLAPPAASASTASTPGNIGGQPAPGTGAIPSAGAVATPPPVNVGDTNWSQVLQDRPDVMAAYNTAVNGDPSKGIPAADRNSPVFLQKGLDSPENYAKYWYNQMGGNSGYTAPTWTQDQIDKAYPQTAGTGTSQDTTTAAGAPATAAPFDSSGIESYLSNLPGYQFTKNQGMQAVTNALGARGLTGQSGAFGKGIARFVTGLADTTYGEQLDRIANAVGVGQSAANQTGAFGSSAASGAAQSQIAGGAAAAGGITGAANAGAAGTIGAANAGAAGLNSVGNAFLTNRILGMYSGSGGGGTTGYNPYSQGT